MLEQPSAGMRRRSLLSIAIALGASTPKDSFSQPKTDAMTPQINAAAELTTLINVFSVAPEKLERQANEFIDCI